MASLGPLMALLLVAVLARAGDRGRDAPVPVVPVVTPSISVSPLGQPSTLGRQDLSAPTLTLPPSAMAGIHAPVPNPAAATASAKTKAPQAFDGTKTQRLRIPDFDPEKTQRIEVPNFSAAAMQAALPGQAVDEAQKNGADTGAAAAAALDALFDNIAEAQNSSARAVDGAAQSGSAFQLLSLADKASALDAPALYRKAAQAATSHNPQFRKAMLRAIGQSAAQRADKAVHQIIRDAFELAKAGQYKKEQQGVTADAMHFWTEVLERSGNWPLKDPVTVQAGLTYIQAQAAVGLRTEGWKLSFTKLLSAKPFKVEVNFVNTAQTRLEPITEHPPSSIAPPMVRLTVGQRYRSFRSQGFGRLQSAARALGAAAVGAWRTLAKTVSSWFAGRAEEVPEPSLPSPQILERLKNIRGEGITVHKPRARVFETGGYRLAHAAPGKAAAVMDEAVTLRVRRGGSAAGIEKLRERFDAFNRLIEANFAALELIAQNPKSMTVKQARAVYQRVLSMAEAYAELADDSADGFKRVAGVKKHGAALEALIGSLAEGESIPEKALELVVPLEKRSLHRIINTLHQLALEKAGRADTGGAANFMVSLHRGKTPPMELALVDLSNDPLVEDGRIVSPGFKALAQALTRSADAPKGSLIMQDHQFWGHFKLGAHSAEIYANFLPPDEGGMIRVRYQEWGTSIENESRLYYVARILTKLGFTVKSDNGFLTAVVDKDHRSQTADQMSASFSMIIQALHATVGLDFAFPIILQGSTTEEESGRRIEQWVDLVLAEGGLPFYKNDQHEQMVAGFIDYRDAESARVKLSMELNAKLRSLGLPELPAETPLGQAVIDKHYNEVLELALARGELAFRGDGTLIRVKGWDPVRSLAVELERGTIGPARMAEAVGSLDTGLLEYETIGAIGALVVSRAQRRLDSDTFLTVYALRDPLTGQIGLARAELGTLTGPPRPISHEKLFALLAEQGYPVAAFTPSDAPPGMGLYLRKLRQLSDFSSDLKFNGLAASPGEGTPLVGIVTYNKAVAASEVRVFVAPYTSPDDLDAIRNSKAVLTTSGGLLSHAAITTREMGIAAAIFGQAQWKDGAMILSHDEFSKPAIFGGLPVRSVKRRSLYEVAEGSVIRFDPASGALELLLPENQPVIQEASRRLAAYQRNKSIQELANWAAGAMRSSDYTEAQKGGLAHELLSSLARRASKSRLAVEHLGRLRAAMLDAVSGPLEEVLLSVEESLFRAERASAQSELRELQEQLLEAGTLPGTERLLLTASARLTRLELLAEAFARSEKEWSTVRSFYRKLEREARKRMESQLAADIKELELHARLYPTITVEILPRIKALVAKAKRRKLAPSYYERWEAEISQLEKTRRSRRGAGPLVLPLSDIHDADAGLVGGKGAKLGEIAEVVARAGAKTAAGFAVTVEAYREFLKRAGIEATVEGLAASAELTPEAKSERIQKLIREAALTPDTAVGQLLIQQLRVSGLAGLPLAVRSSAVDEDGAAAAFAGAGDTHLYVTEAEMLDKVKEVWASLWNPRALLYRQTKGLSTTGLAQAVVIQAMVPSEVAGVAFTEDPVSGNPGRLVVNAAFGLGEGIVSGRVAPDQYVLLKSMGREILPPMIADKRLAVVRDESGRGVTERRMPPSRRRARALSPSQLEKLNTVARALEEHFGYALDLEFAFVGEELYILQARPVTTAAEAPAPKVSLPPITLDKGQGVLFVCAGNTCRSPMAAAMLRQELEDRRVTGVPVASRGLYADEGQPMSKEARDALEERNLSGIGHFAGGLTEADIAGAGLILVMEPGQRDEVLRRFPQALGKVRLVAEFAGEGETTVSDPFGGGRGRYQDTAHKLSQSVSGVASRLAGEF